MRYRAILCVNIDSEVGQSLSQFDLEHRAHRAVQLLPLGPCFFVKTQLVNHELQVSQRYFNKRTVDALANQPGVLRVI